MCVSVHACVCRTSAHAGSVKTTQPLPSPTGVSPLKHPSNHPYAQTHKAGNILIAFLFFRFSELGLFIGQGKK